MSKNNMELSVDLALNTGDFKSGVATINKELKKNEKAFKEASKNAEGYENTFDAVRKKMDFFAKQTDILTKKLSLQEKEYEELGKATDKMKDKLSKIDTSTDKGAKAYDRLAKSIQQNLGKMSTLEGQIDSTKTSLDKMKKATDEAKESVKELTNSGSKMSKLRDALEEAGLGADAFGDSVGGLVENIPGIGGAVGSVAKTSIGKFAGMSAGLGALVGVAGGVVTAVAAIGTKAVSVSGEWESAMRTIENATGSTKKEVLKLGDELKELDSSAWSSGKSQGELAYAVSLVKQQLKELPTDQIDGISESAIAVADTFGLDVSDVIRATDLLMTNLGISGQEAMGLITYGAQNGANAQGDLLDTLTEYAPKFAEAGLSADEFTQMLILGTDAGAMSTDKLADSVKEFGIKAVESSDDFLDNGINKLSKGTQDLYQQYLDGKATVSDVMFSAMKDLQGVDNQVDQNKIGMALFGTQWEDTGSKAILAMSGAKGATIESEKKVKDLTKNVSENKKKWEELKTKGKGAMEDLGRVISPIVGKVLDLANALMDAYDWCKKLWNKITNSKFGQGVSKVMSAVGGIFKKSIEAPTIGMGEVKVPTIEPVNIATTFDTSSLARNGEMLSKAVRNVDFSGARYRSNSSVVSTPTINVNSNDGALLVAMQQQNQLLTALLNKQQTIEAQLYIDGKSLKSHMQTMEKRTNRLAGIM